jgi:cytochrome c553
MSITTAIRRILLGSVLGTTLTASFAASANTASDEVLIKDKTAVCASCHGADGNGIAPSFPRLAGQHASYLAAALNAYRSGKRQNAVMNGVAKDLTDEAIAGIAAYYEALPGKLSTLPLH